MRESARLKKDKKPPKDCTAKWQVCVWSLLIYRAWELNGRGRKLGDKGTGSGITGYKKWEALTPCPPPPNNIKVVKQKAY